MKGGEEQVAKSQWQMVVDAEKIQRHGHRKETSDKGICVKER